MFAPIIRILLCFALCLALSSCERLFCWGCQICEEYQDVAKVALPFVADIDSVAMIVNDSIIGCGNLTSKVVGSKTHRVQFPINVRIRFFSHGDFLKELFFEMDKNTEASIYTGCSNNLTDSIFTDDYCWSIKKMGDNFVNDDIRCTEWNMNREQELCEMRYFQ